MRHELVVFNIPADFILARLIPTSAELAYGVHNGWLSRDDLVTIALAKLERGVDSTGPEEQLLVLSPNDHYTFEELLDVMATSYEPVERRARVWLFLALSWLLENLDDFDDPLGVIELLYADFEYPEEIQGLVRFMPPPPGQPTGLTALDNNWHHYVERVGKEYRERNT
jgi:hypothetical protein